MSRQDTKRLDLDALLQDTYLLVVELRKPEQLSDSPRLWARCVAVVEEARSQLKDAGLSQRSLDLVIHSQCALLDETVLLSSDGVLRGSWAGESLQSRFFNSHQAGESLFEAMREVLREPSPDPQVLSVFQRILMLGFRGRYQQDNDPEREQLLAELNARVAPLHAPRVLPTCARGVRGGRSAMALQSPVISALAVGALLLASWWGLDHALGDLVATRLTKPA